MNWPLRDTLINIPEGPCLLGADYWRLDSALRQEDQAKSLGLGAVLDSTPPHWVDVPAFSIMPRMVSNGEYQQFWQATPEALGGEALIEDIELWEYVWQAYPLTTVRVPGGRGGKTEVENYETCQTAIDALVRSYSFECQRTLLQHHVPLNQYGYDEISKAVVKTFAILRRGLGTVIWHDRPVFEGGEVEALNDGPDTVAAHLLTVDKVLKRVEEPIPPAFADSVPLVVLLRRLRRALEAGSLTFKVGQLLRPLLWPDGEGKASKRGGGLFQTQMSWTDLPVRGVSLYEAAAFAAWLRLETGEPIVLPNEAEYEKAFGWSQSTQPGALEHVAKHVYPWQSENIHDFHYWFARDGVSIKMLEARAKAYQELMNNTSRVIGDQRLYQGLGFGWQWTRERYSELESKYNRFQAASVRSRQVDGQSVYQYEDCSDQSYRYFTVRGAPEQLGGPGTVTRRFALSPLRGYAECGFRCVASQAGAL